MKPRLIVFGVIAVVAALATAGCGKHDISSRNLKVVTTSTSGQFIVDLCSDSAKLSKGTNDIVIAFYSDNNHTKLVDVGPITLKFHKQDSTSDSGKIIAMDTTNFPGMYQANVDISTSGAWTVMVNYKVANVTGNARMTVNVE